MGKSLAQLDLFYAVQQRSILHFLLTRRIRYNSANTKNTKTTNNIKEGRSKRSACVSVPGGGGGGGEALGYFLGGYVPPGTPNWQRVLTKFPLKLIPRSRNGPIFHTPFQLEFALKLTPRSRNGPIFYTPFSKVCKLKQPCFF